MASPQGRALTWSDLGAAGFIRGNNSPRIPSMSLGCVRHTFLLFATPGDYGCLSSRTQISASTMSSVRLCSGARGSSRTQRSCSRRWCRLVAGVSRGFASGELCVPTSHSRLSIHFFLTPCTGQVQVPTDPPRSTFGTLKAVLRNNGVRGLYTGFTVSSLNVVVGQVACCAPRLVPSRPRACDQLYLMH